MEQKRTLWIIAATGIFLLVVIGAALILYSPSMQTKAVKQASFDSNMGWISTPKIEDEANNLSNTPSAMNAVAQTPVSAQSVSDADTSTASQISDNAPAVTITKSSGANVQPNPFESPIKADHITVVTDNTTVYSTDTKTIDLNGLNSTAKAKVAPKNEYTQTKIENNSKSVAIASEPKTTKKAAPSPKASAAPKKTKASETSAKPKAVAKSSATATNTFWVQAAAYSSKKNADEARTVLESNKIPTEVFTVDSNGTMMYRVRTGPYTTKTEAEYWQKEIAKIEKFADTKSQIFSTKIN